MSVTVRFAPSPTGPIHLGNIRTALLNWLFAYQQAGRFLLRFDDTDPQRCKQEYVDSILQDLEWIGIIPERIEYQSRRTNCFLKIFERLKEKGLLYPCYETQEELDIRRKILLSRRKPPVYGREALRLTEKEKEKFLAEGRKPHWRFLLPNYDSDPFFPRKTIISWNDSIRSEQSVDLSSLSDPILVRENMTFPYTLPSVVDDIDFGITDIIRGDDHVTNTAVQIALFQALDAKVPTFGHHNLLTTHTGEGFSKRNKTGSIAEFREKGIEPMVVASFSIFSGTSKNIVPVQTMKDLIASFSLSDCVRSPAKINPSDLEILNQSLLKELSFETIKDRLKALIGDDPRAKDFWYAVRGNLTYFSDIVFWWNIISKKPSAVPNFCEEDKEFVNAAFDLLPLEPWTKNTWTLWKEKTMILGRKGKAFYHPLRLAITGCDSGPELPDLLLLIGREGILSRRF